MKMWTTQNFAPMVRRVVLGLALVAGAAPLPGLAQVTLTLDFSSPATNASPGATFTGSVSYAPTGAVITASVLSGTSIVPLANLSLTSVDSNTVHVILEPLTNTSGQVTVQVRGVSGSQTDTVSFVTVFRPYPPVIAPISNRTMLEDGTTNVPFVVTDGDTPLASLVLDSDSSNTALIGPGEMSLGGSGSNRFISLTPKANINGASTVTVSVTDGEFTNARSFVITVSPVADPSTISGLVNRAFGDNAGLTNVFAGVAIADVDHNMPVSEQLVATATLADDQFATFASGLITHSFTGTPAQVTTAMAGVGVQALPFRSIPGTINDVGAAIRVRGVSDNITVTSSVTLAIEVIDTPPTFNVILNPTSLVEGASSQPFYLSFIYDPDLGDDEFTLGIELVNTNQSNLLTLGPTNVLSDNNAGLLAAIRNINVQATPAALTSLTERVALRFTLTDGFGGVTVQTNELTLVQALNPPQITGIPVQTVNKTSSDPAFLVYPTAFVQDANQGGLQPVQAILTQSDASLGTFSATSFPFMTPAQLSTALQGLTYTPTPGARPVGTIAESILSVRAIDSSGLSASNTSVKIRITSVNGAPQILNVPSSADQPLLIQPTPPLRPFSALGLWNDDTNLVVFTLSLDNSDKGTLTNLGSFAQTSPGTIRMTGTVAAIVGSLTNLAYVLNAGYAFPPDDPGGSTFTLSARDYALLTTTTSLYIQVQEAPRNHLVVRAQNDGLPGSFTYALAQAGNNDVITFALPAYPAVVRMPGALPNTLIRNVTIKGPGANLLAISGDGNGDTVPDRQLFGIRSRVTIEGVTLTHGTAGFGGALRVESNGVLTLRRCAVVDSVAAQYGGAIDVDGGQLTLDGCFIGRNRLANDTGMSGAGVSIYSDRDIEIVNTTFAGNLQPNPSGDGGGALVVQNLTPSTPMRARIAHCTFLENEDEAGAASAVLGVDFGTRIQSLNSIFRDFSGRNLEVAGAAEFVSLGGNLCDDSSRTLNLQQGQSGDVFLLNHVTDETETDPLLAPLNLAGDPTPFAEPLAGSPAIAKGVNSTNTLDQRGVLRQGVPDAGAIEFNALGRLVIDEILFDGGEVAFIELYVRRDSTPVDLAPYALFVDGVKVHDFAAGTIIGTNLLYAAGSPAPTLVNPGFGYVLAFTNNPIHVTSDSNPTPVARPSVTNATLALNARGLITIGAGGSAEPVARQAYLGIYLDPASGTNLLVTTGNSIALAPQYRGFALIPHSLILPGPFDGADLSRSLAVNQYSLGTDILGTPFGQDNAEPLAVPDIFTVTEDDLSELAVLANDFDGDGNDRKVIVDVSTDSDPAVGDSALTNSQLGASVAVDPDTVPLRGERLVFDPRAAPGLQQLPVGVETIDTLYYEILDVGFAAVEGYSDAGGGTTVVAATHHRLTNGAEVVISGVEPTAYTGTLVVTVVDEDAFSIAVPFAGASTSNGQWQTVLPRAPTSRSEASVSVRVVGVNDAPVVGLDVITNVTERSTVRLMVRPEQAGSPLVFPGDPVPAPVMLTQQVLTNDDDVDADDTWSTLRPVGVLGAVQAITGYAGTPGEMPVTVTSPAHGLTNGAQVLIANYGGHPAYNGYQIVTVLDPDTFTIPQYFVDNDPQAGVWVILNEANRYSATTDVGAAVSLTLRANPEEDYFIYDANPSAFLQGLAVGERHTNRFYYAVEDSHGGIGIGPIDVVVDGVNNIPASQPDPGSIGGLDPLVTPSNSLTQVLTAGLDLMYTLPPVSGRSNRVDLQVLDLSGLLPGTVVIDDIFSTDEDTSLPIVATNLVLNDSDVDRTDLLVVTAVDTLSREGATITFNSGLITYQPSSSTNLQALAREEMVIDTFTVRVSDGQPNGTVTSLVAVLVVGVNDTPVANPVFLTTHEDEVLVFDPRTNDVEIDINQAEPDNRLRVVSVTNWPNPGQADVDMSTTNVTHDAPASQLLNQLADWQSFTNVFNYTITDNSFLFATDDEFYVPAGTVGRVLGVLVNDRDFTDAAGVLTIIDAGPSLHGGTVTISTNGQSLVYSSPVGYVGDDYFRYTIQNDRGDIDHARVMVRSVVAAINGVLHAADDHYLVAAGETAVMPVLANDHMLPLNGAGLTITALVSSSLPGQPVLTNNTFVYVATNGLTPLTFRYEVSGGGTARAQAEVTLGVVERRGTLNIQDDAFSVLPGSFDNELDVLGNDGLVTESISALRIGDIPGPASHGLLTTNAAGTRLVYTPTSGFIGVERVAYLAVDQAGGTATGWVDIAVGKLDVAADFYKVAATTNPVPVLLDVLANDRIQPAVRGSLTLLSVTPSTPTTNGTMSVGGAGAYLLFTPSNTLGQMEFDYVVQDGGVSPRVATGRVTLATVASGTYANPDTYLVRGGGANYVLNVLTNDRGYPALNRTYSILSIGTGPNAPDHGGSVSIVGDTLVYTPAVGFFGEESFTYVMSDSVATDVARVTVSVRRGDLHANDDVYAVYYALAPGTNIAVSFNLPVLLNDRILPPLDQVMTLSALGVGTNAPDQGGVVQIAPGLQSLVYRPVLATTTGYVEQFTYEYTDGGDRRASAVVRVHVQNRASNLVALTQADAFTVARSSSNNMLPVLANDFVLPGSAAGWSVTAVSPSLFGASVSISNTAVRYTPVPGFVGVDTFTYSVSDGLGGTGSATVSVRVGSLPTLPDRFSVLSGTTGNDFDVVSNDVLVTTYADEYPLHSVFGANAGGALALSGHNTVLYAPAASHLGGYPYTETFFYRVADESGVLVTGEVQVTVHDAASDRDTSTITLLVEGRNDRPEIANAAPLLQITDKEYVKPFPAVLITEVDQQLQEAIDVSVQLGLPDQGLFRNLDGFVQAAPGYYVLTNTTAAWATARLRDLIFEPTENRITVPTSEDTRFTIQVTDNKSAPVVDTNSVVTVTAINDAPVILGTRAGQRVYARLPIRLFSSVTIQEVDDLTLQPLDITITMNARTNGSITNLTPFVLSTTGVYRATNITAAAASSALRSMEFWVATNLFPTSTQLLTQFSIAVSDRFAAVVQDSVTTVIAYDAPEGVVRPTNITMRGSFGIAVDTLSDYAVVGAPNAGGKGANAGAAFVYQRNPGSSNTWTEWRVLQPSQVETNDRFGRSVAISDDYLAVGAINDEVGGVEVGSVYLYQRHLGGTNNWGEWIRITPTNITNAIRFGYALDLEGDTLVVGAPDAQLAGGIITQGAVFVFNRHAGGPDAWGEVARRVPSDPGLTNAEFGFSVALSGDQLVVGAPKLNVNLTTTAREGAVFQFARDEGGPDNWGPVRRLTAVETNLSVEFGWDVALDGSVLAIGAPAMTAGAVTNAGRVYVYTMPSGGTQWLATVTLDRRNDNERRFGNGLGLEGDRLLVGAPYNNGAQNLGAAYLYRLDPLTNTNWILLDTFRRPAGSTAGLFGTAVGLDADAGIVGAPADYSDVSNRGFAYLYRFKQNNAPMLVAPVADQVAPLGVPYGFPIPGGTFADPDVDDALVLSATFPSGSNGLDFISLTVTGTPAAVGLTPVALQATDESGASATQTFDVIVVDGINLLGSQRDLWNLDHFGNAVTNPALAGSLWGGGANPDGDELDNDQEYVFGGDPSVPEDRRIRLSASGDGLLLINYFRRTDDPDLLYMLQGSGNLKDWADLNWTVVNETAVAWSDQLEYVTIQVAVDALTRYQHYRIVVFW